MDSKFSDEFEFNKFSSGIDAIDSTRLENRQLTLMFCDLVESTTIAQKLDAENWREFLNDFQQTCTWIFAKYGGYVHEYRGDGPLVYFGYPTAFEDSAFRAVKAGVEITRYFKHLAENKNTLSSLTHFDTPQVRIGIHTGQVVTGEMAGRPTATGSMVALAERLQRVASPNGVVVSRDTLNLVKTKFRAVSLGKKPLKGFEGEHECFKVESEMEVDSTLTPFIGRLNEFAKLQSVWNSLVVGRPKTLLISAEAGIGKSRLVSEFAKSIRSDSTQIVKWQCASYYKNSAFYPVGQAIRKMIGATGGWGPDKLRKAVTELSSGFTEAQTSEIGSVIEAFWDPETRYYPELEGSSEQRRTMVQNSIVNWFANTSHNKPILMIVEDINWIDPSSLELLGRLAEHQNSGPLLLILTHRRENDESWNGPIEVEEITLGRVSQSSADEIVRSFVGSQMFSQETVDYLVQHTDGVPLFIEEFTAMVVENYSNADIANLSDKRSAVNVPSTIQDLLTARLESVGQAKTTAQLASVIGREFSLKLLSAIWGSHKEQLYSGLQSLIDSGLLLQKKAGSENQYVFKHGLVADAAYASLVSSKKKKLHGQIAELLETECLSSQTIEPELLAHHYIGANNFAKAIKFWMEAGRKSKRRAALKEAISHYTQALSLLDRCSQDTGLNIETNKLASFAALAACHEAVGGYSVKEAHDSYVEAEKIAKALPDQEALLIARMGLSSYFMMRGEFARAQELGVWCLAESETACQQSANDEAIACANVITMAQASFTLGCVLFHKADFDGAMMHMSRCIELGKSTTAAQRRMRHDPMAMSLIYQAWYTWEAGLPDKSLSLVKQGVEITQKGGHPFGIGVALAFQACIHFFRREYPLVIEFASQSIAISEEPGYKTWLAWAKVIRGRAICECSGNCQEGIDEILEGLRLWDESGAIVTRPFALTLLAEAYQINQQIDEAFASIQKAKETIEHYGERYYAAEINRVYGNLILNSDIDEETKVNKAEEAFLEAQQFAIERGMQSSVLRSTMCLSCIAWKRGNQEASVKALEDALSPFTEGHDTGDLKTAREMIQLFRSTATNEVGIEKYLNSAYHI